MNRNNETTLLSRLINLFHAHQIIDISKLKQNYSTSDISTLLNKMTKIGLIYKISQDIYAFHANVAEMQFFCLQETNGANATPAYNNLHCKLTVDDIINSSSWSLVEESSSIIDIDDEEEEDEDDDWLFGNNEDKEEEIEDFTNLFSEKHENITLEKVSSSISKIPGYSETDAILYIPNFFPVNNSPLKISCLYNDNILRISDHGTTFLFFKDLLTSQSQVSSQESSDIVDAIEETLDSSLSKICSQNKKLIFDENIIYFNVSTNDIQKDIERFKSGLQNLLSKIDFLWKNNTDYVDKAAKKFIQDTAKNQYNADEIIIDKVVCGFIQRMIKQCIYIQKTDLIAIATELSNLWHDRKEKLISDKLLSEFENFSDLEISLLKMMHCI